MIGRRKFSAIGSDPQRDAATLAQAHLAHIASLREARIHHRAIAHELRSFYDSVAAETVPAGFFQIFLEDGVERP